MAVAVELKYTGTRLMGLGAKSTRSNACSRIETGVVLMLDISGQIGYKRLRE